VLPTLGANTAVHVCGIGSVSEVCPAGCRQGGLQFLRPVVVGLGEADPLGEPVRPYTYSDRFEILCRKAGVPVVQLHAVRHTLATIMHKAGEAPADAAALLGHTVAVHLARYVTPTEKGARTAASGLGAAISGLG
jgi:integrase